MGRHSLDVCPLLVAVAFGCSNAPEGSGVREQAPIYALFAASDNAVSFVSLNPVGETFETLRIGTAECPTPSGNSYYPYSMAIDRDGHAWVVFSDFDYSSSRLYRIDLQNLSCELMYEDNHVFSIAFQSETPCAPFETLLTAEAHMNGMTSAEFALASLNVESGVSDSLGTITTMEHIPPIRLTSTDEQQLLGYFHGAGVDAENEPFVTRIDTEGLEQSATWPVVPWFTSNHSGVIGVSYSDGVVLLFGTKSSSFGTQEAYVRLDLGSHELNYLLPPAGGWPQESRFPDLVAGRPVCP